MTDRKGRRSQAWYAKLTIDHVTQADTYADLDFLVGRDTRTPWRESH